MVKTARQYFCSADCFRGVKDSKEKLRYKAGSAEHTESQE